MAGAIAPSAVIGVAPSPRGMYMVGQRQGCPRGAARALKLRNTADDGISDTQAPQPGPGIPGGAPMSFLKLLWLRAVIFGLGVFSVWLIVFVVFRFTDNRLPWILALGVTYGVGAYVVLPWIIRFGLMVTRRNHVPAYTAAGDGLPGDPVNIALAGTLPQLKAAFAAIGWVEAEPLGLASSWRMARSFVLNEPYPNAPFSTLYLFGRGQDIGFQKAIGDSPRKRHHIRFWAVSTETAENGIGTARFWGKAPRPDTGQALLWVGAATKDTGLSLTRLSFQITHATDADTNAERDFVMAELARAGRIGDVRSFDETSELPARRVNHYVFDGDVSVATLTA